MSFAFENLSLLFSETTVLFFPNVVFKLLGTYAGHRARWPPWSYMVKTSKVVFSGTSLAISTKHNVAFGTWI